MSDDKKPDSLSDEDLKGVSGGITFDNGIKRKVAWRPEDEKILSEKSVADGVIRMEDSTKLEK